MTGKERPSNGRHEQVETVKIKGADVTRTVIDRGAAYMYESVIPPNSSTDWIIGRTQDVEVTKR